MRLAQLGWDDTFAAAFERRGAGLDVEPARVAIEFNHIYRVWTTDAELEATVSGRLKHHAAHRSELPAVGDWVVVRRGRVGDRATDQAAIVAVLPRRSWFSRKMAGTITDEQIVAANVNVVFIAMALDADFSLRRLERYLLLARESGAAPVILLTKPDVSDALTAQVADVRSVSGELPVEVIAVLWIGSRTTQAYGEHDLEAAERVSAQIAGAVANSQLYERIQQFYAQEQRRAEQFRTIGEVGRRLTSIRDPNELLTSIGEIGTTALGYETTALGIIEGDVLGSVDISVQPYENSSEL